MLLVTETLHPFAHELQHLALDLRAAVVEVRMEPDETRVKRITSRERVRGCYLQALENVFCEAVYIDAAVPPGLDYALRCVSDDNHRDPSGGFV